MAATGDDITAPLAAIAPDPRRGGLRILDGSGTDDDDDDEPLPLLVVRANGGNVAGNGVGGK